MRRDFSSSKISSSVVKQKTYEVKETTIVVEDVEKPFEFSPSKVKKAIADGRSEKS